MEMEINDSDEMEGFVDEEPCTEQLNSCPYQNGINGEPEILPRVGDEYQAVIPVFVSKHDRLKLVKQFESENVITFGLPIPLMWTRSEKFKGFVEAEKEKASPSSDEQEAEPEDPRRGRRKSIVLALPCQRNVKLEFDWLGKSRYPFPGTLGESWEGFEKERFLLGLYCLGKNLVLIQRFVGSKKMGDTLSYYYGTFYRSNEYRRWVDGRKSRCRRSIQGQKLFTGWRLQELLSRISPNVTEECKSMLLKVTKEFREDKIAIEEFVFAVKENVGVDLFTEAIGIGKGKRDLTNSALEPTRTNHGGNSSEVVKIGNDLPVSDIVKFLTGEYRMSKTKSCDLFWEAVWPRLLAKGWHSEQPKDGPRNSLVFLIPESNKFSRRKMTKGKDYFDSLADVLNRVKLDPRILLLETDNEEEFETKSKEEAEKNNKDESQDGKRKKRYLQPRSKQSKSSQEVNMFTIVDTSDPNNFKKVRSLPVEVGSGSSMPPSFLRESEDSLSEESDDNDKEEETTMASRVCGGGGSISSVNMENVTSRSTISLNGKEKPKKNKGGRPRNKPTSAKRSSLLADCTLRESVSFGEETKKKKKKEKKPVKRRRPNPSEAERIEQTLKQSSEDDDSSCRRKQEEEDRVISSSPEKKAREDFDLNVAQIEQEADAGTVTGVQQNSESSCAEEQSSVKENVEEDMIPERRQSTRTRPLTARALEAIAFGYLGNSKKKRKASEEEEPRNKSRRKSTKRIRGGYSEFRNGTVKDDGSNSDDE